MKILAWSLGYISVDTLLADLALSPNKTEFAKLKKARR